MFKYIILVSLFVVGTNAACSTMKRVNCIMAQLTSTGLDLPKSEICSNISSIAACQKKANCEGGLRFFNGICSDSDCDVRQAVTCILKVRSDTATLMNSIRNEVQKQIDCLQSTTCLNSEDVPEQVKKFCVALNI